MPVDLSPSEQIALLTLRRNQSSLSRMIVERMTRSTVRASFQDYQSLIRQGFAMRKAGEQLHVITPKGFVRAQMVEHVLAKELGIERDRHVFGIRTDGRYGRFTKSTFHPW